MVKILNCEHLHMHPQVLYDKYKIMILVHNLLCHSTLLGAKYLVLHAFAFVY